MNGFKEGTPLSRDVVSSILFIDKHDLPNCQIITYKSNPGRADLSVTLVEVKILERIFFEKFFNSLC